MKNTTTIIIVALTVGSNNIVDPKLRRCPSDEIFREAADNLDHYILLIDVINIVYFTSHENVKRILIDKF